MEKPIYVKPISKRQRIKLEAELRSRDAYVMRRSQIILASRRGEKASEIAKNLGCSGGTVRNTINAFNEHGLECLKKKSCRPKKLRTIITDTEKERIRDLLHTSPRNLGKESSLWTLEMVAEVSYEWGLTAHKVTAETIRQTLKRLGINWRRAKHWITSPDPQYELKKSNETD